MSWCIYVRDQLSTSLKTSIFFHYVYQQYKIKVMGYSNDALPIGGQKSGVTLMLSIPA